MIARIWRGAVAQADGDAYANYIDGTGMAAYTKTPGNRGAWMLRRDVDGNTEFLMFTLWDSMESITAFAGDDPDVAVSHDRYFLDRIADRVIRVADGGVRDVLWHA